MLYIISKLEIIIHLQYIQRYTLYFFVSEQIGPFWAVLKLPSNVCYFCDLVFPGTRNGLNKSYKYSHTN